MSNVYVQYTVQLGDTLWDLWSRAHMSREEWIRVNAGRDSERTLYAGETITIKDPVTTCMQKDGYRLAQETHFSNGGQNTNVCADAVIYASFRPLERFIKRI